jgi:hypothetical protein
MGLFLSRVREIRRCFEKLPIFSPVEPFCTKNKFFNFFVHRAEKIRIFASLFENSKNQRK